MLHGAPHMHALLAAAEVMREKGGAEVSTSSYQTDVAATARNELGLAVLEEASVGGMSGGPG